MSKISLLAVLAASLGAYLVSPAMASSIKADLSQSQVASVCGSVPVGTVSTVQVTLPDGSIVAGTVHCEHGDASVGSDDPANHDLADDSATGTDDDGQPGSLGSGTSGDDGPDHGGDGSSNGGTGGEHHGGGDD